MLNKLQFKKCFKNNLKTSPSPSSDLTKKRFNNSVFKSNTNQNEINTSTGCSFTANAAVVTPNGHVVAQEDPEDEKNVIDHKEFYKTPKKHRHLKKKLF